MCPMPKVSYGGCGGGEGGGGGEGADLVNFKLTGICCNISRDIVLVRWTDYMGLTKVKHHSNR